MNELFSQINKIAQGILPLSDGMNWFDEKNSIDRKETLAHLYFCLIESNPSSMEIKHEIDTRYPKDLSPLSRAIRFKDHHEAREIMRGLSEIEQEKAFELCLAIFASADKRRRKTQCIGGCGHEWHNIAS